MAPSEGKPPGTAPSATLFGRAALVTIDTQVDTLDGLRPGTAGRLLAPGLLEDGAPDLDDDLLLGGGIQPLGDDEVALYKPRWGAFFRTPLEAHLRDLDIDTLVFAGCNFPNCPRASVYEASERDFGIVLVDDAVSGLYDRGRAELRGIGVTLLCTTDLVGALSGLVAAP